MKIFNWVIKNKDNILLNETIMFGKGYPKGVEDMVFRNQSIIEELKRLKNDHWDKEAFDRIIERLKR